MHRQSLGSPVSKLPIRGGASGGAAEEAAKPMRPAAASPERSIHLIPLLTLLCLLVLYLCSHVPSAKELDGVGGAAALMAAKGLGISERLRLVGAEKEAEAAARGYRGLKEEAEERLRRNRKLGVR